jgi:hypothetical protein
LGEDFESFSTIGNENRETSSTVFVLSMFTSLLKKVRGFGMEGMWRRQMEGAGRGGKVPGRGKGGTLGEWRIGSAGD